jgi:ABC-2 type transport system permease protein
VSDLAQAWLVAKREIRERSRSRAFRASLLVMVMAVAAMIILPAVLTGSARTRDVALTGFIPNELAPTIRTQGAAVGTVARIRRIDTLAAGEVALRNGDVDVLVVDARRLEWPHKADEKLQAVVTGAIQLVAVRQRAAHAGMNPDTVLALVAPVRVDNVELGAVAGRSRGDEIATIVMTGILLLTISIYGGLVLSSVVEEKASRIVEVLLARIPARSLLAGKVAGIGLLGLGQIGVTALVALVAVSIVGSFDLPAVRGAVLAWVVVWFLLGYVFYATLYGALGSLAARPEDAQSVAGPAMMVMILSYFGAFTMVAQPDSAASKAISFFPTTAPMAMPGRFAMGATAWWEPVVAVAIMLVAILALVRIGGRLYAAAILRGGPTLSLRDAWRSTLKIHSASQQDDSGTLHIDGWRKVRAMTDAWATRPKANHSTHRRRTIVLIIIGVGLGTAVALLTNDGMIGVMAGAGFFALAVQAVRAWTRHAT